MKYTKIKKSLMVEAAERFPKGTIYHPINSSTGNIMRDSIFEVKNEYVTWHEDTMCRNGNIWHNGDWAEIISTPKKPIKPLYGIY